MKSKLDLFVYPVSSLGDVLQQPRRAGPEPIGKLEDMTIATERSRLGARPDPRMAYIP